MADAGQAAADASVKESAPLSAQDNVRLAADLFCLQPASLVTVTAESISHSWPFSRHSRSCAI